MAEEFQIGGGSWWDSSRNRFESGAPPPPPPSASSSAALNSMGSLGWPMDVANLDFKTRSCNFMDSVSVSSNSMAYQDTQNLQMVGLGLSSHPMDWNQTISLRGGGKPETSFQSGLQQTLTSAANFPPEIGMVDTWRQKPYSSNISDQSNEYKQFSPNISSSFQIDPSAYTTPSSSQAILLGSENHLQRPNFLYPENYRLNYSAELSPLSSKFPRFPQNPPPKQPPINPFQFSNNNGTLWSTTSESMNDVRSSPFFSPPTFDEKPKNKSEVRDFGKVTKKSSSEASNKRSRSETSSPLPPFKVRKEKMGDKITALQQLVSPFGKTDTASVLSEAIEYIKFLHEQVNVFSKPYMKSGAPIQHHQSFDKPKDSEGPKQNLRSRGLCLVPVSSTFPITHETTVDFWTPTFGGTLR